MRYLYRAQLLTLSPLDVHKIMNKIVHLLNAAGSSDIFEACLDVIEKHSGELVQLTDPLPRAHVLDIYETRNRIRKTRNSKVRGYELLLKNLGNSEYGDVKIYSIKSTNQNFRIFVNEDETYLFGVLQLDKEIES